MSDVQMIGFQTLRSDISVGNAQIFEIFQFPGVPSDPRLLRLSFRAGRAQFLVTRPPPGEVLTQTAVVYYYWRDKRVQLAVRSKAPYPPVPPDGSPVLLDSSGEPFEFTTLTAEKPEGVTSVVVSVAMQRSIGGPQNAEMTFVGSPSDDPEASWSCSVEDLGPIT